MPSEQPVIQGYTQGIPIWRFGFTWLLDEAPDLVDPAPLQAGNPAAPAKVHPKKSWEIHHNRLGATTTRMPRTPENDYLPQEAIHLIDGDLQTTWCSRSQPQADVEPVWIRLDLPRERMVARVVLRKRPAGGFARTVGMVGPDAAAVEIGRAMAGELTIQVSRDGWHWETVFDGPTGDGPGPLRFRVQLSCTAGEADLDHRTALPARGELDVRLLHRRGGGLRHGRAQRGAGDGGHRRDGELDLPRVRAGHGDAPLAVAAALLHGDEVGARGLPRRSHQLALGRKGARGAGRRSRGRPGDHGAGRATA